MKLFSFLTIFLLVPSLANASPAATCKTEAYGRWVVTSFYVDGVSAVDEAGAKKYVGSKLFISKDRVAFSKMKCDVVKVSRGKTDADDGSHEAKYPLSIDFTCKNNVDVPSVMVGKSCTKILATLGEGPIYILRRQ